MIYLAKVVSDVVILTHFFKISLQLKKVKVHFISGAKINYLLRID